MKIDITIDSEVSTSSRAKQLAGMFDVPVRQKQTLRWEGEAPIEAQDWNIGLIVGPSGCGKSTIARNMFGDFAPALAWPSKSVIDDFPAGMPIGDISAICQSVGFNTVPAWLRPYDVLSNGEKFRVELARRMVEASGTIVVDEFTSVVDRQVAQIGSYAVAKAIRKKGRKFVAVSCHSDIIEWLNPDWILEPSTMTFHWRALCRRPSLAIDIYKVPHDDWRIFAPFHYMSADLHNGAQCYCLHVDGSPAAFAALLFRPHPKVRDIWGLSRIVTLPDYQGLGLAFVLMDRLGEALAGMRARMHTYPAHPALIRSFDASPKWRLEKKPGMSNSSKIGALEFGGRPNAVFSWAGGSMEEGLARPFLSIKGLH